MAKKYYWLKLKNDFFKRHDIKIIEAMPNGKDYVLFYLKLLVESVGHEGELRFSETIPYNVQMLSTITNTNVDIAKAAIELFTNLELMHVLDDETIYMKEVQKMVGEETEWARKKRLYREKQALIEDKTKTEKGQEEDNVHQKEDNVRQELEKEKELEKELYNNMCIFFEKMWSLYPSKKGKGQIKDACKKKVFKLGDEFERCIKRYIDYVEKRQATDFPDLKYQNGSTFFNSGYLDYMDSNYEEYKASKPIAKKNTFTDYSEQRNYDYDAMEKKAMEMRLKEAKND